MILAISIRGNVLDKYNYIVLTRKKFPTLPFPAPSPPSNGLSLNIYKQLLLIGSPQADFFFVSFAALYRRGRLFVYFGENKINQSYSREGSQMAVKYWSQTNNNMYESMTLCKPFSNYNCMGRNSVQNCPIINISGSGKLGNPVAPPQPRTGSPVIHGRVFMVPSIM